MLSFRIVFLLLFAVHFHSANAQHQERQYESRQPDTIAKLVDVFRKAEIEGHVRNFFMTTINQGNLRDYYTNATGGAIGIKTMPYKGLSIGVKGIFTYQTFSSDLNKMDDRLHKVSKWEHELYDINDLDNYNDLDRLEELYVEYAFKKGSLTFGKMPIQESNLVNRSDGRMKPFAFSGLQLRLAVDSSTSLHLAAIGKVSPRSTVEWYQFDEAIGIVNNGIQPSGKPANYRGQSDSKGFSVLGIEKNIGQTELTYYNYHIHRMINTSLVEWYAPISKFGIKLQYALQFADSYQAQLDYENRYVQPHENGQFISVHSKWKQPKSSIALAYTHLFATGRFLFPRELGRDHLSTSISRSRAEGLGNANVLTLDYQYILNEQLSFQAEATTVIQNENGRAEFNKYNLDDYYQFNTRIHYTAQDFFEGLELSLLYVFKENYRQNQAELIFNRSNFHQINCIINYNF